MVGMARLAGARQILSKAGPSLNGLAAGLIGGAGLPGAALTAGTTQYGERLGRNFFADNFGDTEFFKNMAAKQNTKRRDFYDLAVESPGMNNALGRLPHLMDEPRVRQLNYVNGRAVPAFVEQSSRDVAGQIGGYVGQIGGIAAGLGSSAILGSIFAPDEPERPYALQPVSPQEQAALAAVAMPLQQQQTMQQQQAMQQQAIQQGQSPPQQGMIPLNAEQVSKAQKRAFEQAALNQYYAEQLAQYPVQ